MAEKEYSTIKNALAEYNSSLSPQQLDFLTTIGLGQSAIEKYAQEHLGIEIKGEKQFYETYDKMLKEVDALIYDEQN